MLLFLEVSSCDALFKASPWSLFLGVRLCTTTVLEAAHEHWTTPSTHESSLGQFSFLRADVSGRVKECFCLRENSSDGDTSLSLLSLTSLSIFPNSPALSRPFLVWLLLVLLVSVKRFSRLAFPLCLHVFCNNSCRRSPGGRRLHRLLGRHLALGLESPSISVWLT